MDHGGGGEGRGPSSTRTWSICTVNTYFRIDGLTKNNYLERGIYVFWNKNGSLKRRNLAYWCRELLQSMVEILDEEPGLVTRKGSNPRVQ